MSHLKEIVLLRNFCNNSLHENSNVWFKGGFTIYFNNNLAGRNGGAVCCKVTATIIFVENSTVEFCNNKASLSGGAISTLNNSNILFTGRSMIYFSKNFAKQHGGVIYLLLLMLG